MGRVAAGVAASAAAEYGSAEAAQQRIGLSNPHQGAQPDEPGTRPAHVAGFFVGDGGGTTLSPFNGPH